jgi:aldose 1-epimerase
MKIDTGSFGGSPATLIDITNDAGGALTLTDLGATVTALKVPARTGGAEGPIDVVLGYGSYDDYLSADTYFGATVGRYANRIAGGALEIGGRTYALDRNQGGRHTLHGGADGWRRRIWAYEIDEPGGAVEFSLRSPDGDQGFPGNADIRVTYTLTNDNELRIAYSAVADADTVFNLTNHTYFNLNGEGSGDVLGHLLRIGASRFTPADADAVPTGEIRAVAGSALDFTSEKRIGRDIDADEEQIALAHGYDHNFIADGASGDDRSDRRLRDIATARSEVTGIAMTVRTDLPGVQFYSGNYLGAGPPSKSGGTYARRSGFCLETQFFPDSPHHASFPSTLFRAGEPFESVTEYAFSLG